jgi:hypothetical protein
MEVRFVLEVFCEFQVGPRLEIMALRVKENMNPSRARVVRSVFLAGTSGNPMAQIPVLKIEPIVDLDLFNFFCVLENHGLHETTSIRHRIPGSLLTIARVRALGSLRGNK